MEPEFLSREEVLAIHEDQLARHGGFLGLRDAEALDTALAAPEARINDRFVHGDLAGMAAAYLYHLARYRPFTDGNRRTAVMATLIFLALNDASLTAEPDDLTAIVRAAAVGEADLAAVARWVGERI